MVKVYIAGVAYDQNGRRRISAVLQWGGQETFDPLAIGLRTIDSIVLSGGSINTTSPSFPVGSVPTQLGSPSHMGYYRGGGIGSTITLRWVRTGTTGTRLLSIAIPGTASQGTKTAHAWITGQAP